MATELPDDLDLLIALDVFLRERHVTRAARRLGITQSAASQRLGKLREFFGDPLLVPGRPTMVATPRAQTIAAPLSAALSALRAAIAVGAPFDPRTSERTFVLLGNDIAEAVALPLLVPLLAKEAPRVALHIERADETFVDRLERGTADGAFVPEMVIPPSVRRRPLPPERFVVLMRGAHPMAKKKLTLERYLELGHVLIAPRGLPGSIVDSALESIGKRRRVMVRMQHFVTVPYVLASSDLVVTCPASVARAAVEQFDLRAVAPPIALPIDRSAFVWHERVQHDPGHIWLRQHIEAYSKIR